MNYSAPQNQQLRTHLQESGYFANENHDFIDKNQQQWVDFCISATLQTLSDIQQARTDITLRETLSRLGRGRNEFAEKVQHVDLKGGNSFGAWRESNSPTIAGAAAKAERQQAKGETQLNIEVGFVSTPIYTHQVLYKHVEENLALTEKHRPQDLVKTQVSAMTNQILVHFMKRRGITLKPIEKFETATFEQNTFHASHGSNTRFALTSFYRITNISPFVIMLEHPHSKIANMLLNLSAEPLFQQCVEAATGEGKQSKHSKHTQLENIAQLAWYCFQIMPFIRGSAGVLQILIASLLVLNGIELKSFSGIRLDIDALSLSKSLFTDRFVQDYR